MGGIALLACAGAALILLWLLAEVVLRIAVAYQHSYRQQLSGETDYSLPPRRIGGAVGRLGAAVVHRLFLNTFYIKLG